jgi:hypothetical protein
MRGVQALVLHGGRCSFSIFGMTIRPAFYILVLFVQLDTNELFQNPGLFATICLEVNGGGDHASRTVDQHPGMPTARTGWNFGEIGWPPMGRSDGRQWGELDGH